MIRVAEPLDLDAIMELAESIGLQSEFQRGVVLDQAHMRAVAANLIASKDSVILLAMVNGAPVGMLGLAIYPHLLSGQSMAAQLFWWVLPAHRGRIGVELLAMAEHLARERGASSMQMMAPTKGFASVYQRSGYVKTADVFEKGLS